MGCAAVAIVSYAYIHASVGTPVDPAVIFLSIALFNLLRQPLQFIPLLISACLKGAVSAVRRIDKYLHNNDGAVEDPPMPTEAGTVIEAKRASVSWDGLGARVKTNAHLTEINLSVQQCGLQTPPAAQRRQRQQGSVVAVPPCPQ